MNIYYPEIYPSNEVLKILNSNPVLPTKPQEPIQPQKPINPGEYDSGGNRGCFTFMVIGSIVLFFYVISSDNDNKFSLICISIFLFLCSFFLFKTTSWDKDSHYEKQKKYREDLCSYPDKLKIYETELANYKKKLMNYEAEVKRITSAQAISLFRSNSIKAYLRSRRIPDFVDIELNDIVKRGASEEYFKGVIVEHGFNLLDGKKIKVGSTYFYPDILIESNGIYIDIEIDEPYAGNDGTPIHYMKKDYVLVHSIDEDRNNYFTSKGVEVIRFSEEQIFCHTEECINVIEAYISSLINGKKYSSANNEICILPKWTYEDSVKMAYRRFRRTYVPSEYQTNIDKEIQLSYQDIQKELRNNREKSVDTDDFPF